MRASVVISTLDRAEWLAGALASLRLQRHPEFEVVVVNGPSVDHTDVVLASWQEQIKWLHCAEANLCVSRNAGLAAAAGEVVAFLDDDAVPVPGWLEALVAGFAAPGVGAVAGHVLSRDGRREEWRTTVTDRLLHNREFATPEAAAAAGALVGGVIRVTGCNCAFRREALLAVGGFDENLTLLADDVDISLRLLDRGWRIAVAPRARVYHFSAPNATRDAAGRRRSFHRIAQDCTYFVWRHAPALRGYAGTLEHLVRWSLDFQDWIERADEFETDEVAPLAATVRSGLAAGTRRAFGGRGGRLPQALPAPAGFKPFPVPLPAARRVRLALVMAREQGESMGLARSLAAAGHEIAVIVPGAEEDKTSFVDGVWIIHRRSSGAPAAVPEPFTGHGAKILDDLRRLTEWHELELAWLVLPHGARVQELPVPPGGPPVMMAGTAAALADHLSSRSPASDGGAGDGRGERSVNTTSGEVSCRRSARRDE
jgi:glycogen synthase